MLVSGFSWHFMYKRGFISRMALYPKTSIAGCGFIAICALLTSLCQPFGLKKLPIYLVTCGICGVAAAPIISMGALKCGELFPRLVLCSVIIIGHCTTVAAVAPNELFLLTFLYLGTFLGAVNASVLTHILFSKIGIVPNMVMLFAISGIGFTTVKQHTDHVLESYTDSKYDPCNKGVILLIEAVRNCFAFFKKKFGKDDDSDGND